MINAGTKVMAALMLLAGAVGCASVPAAATYTKPKYVSMLTDGVTIHAESGTWTIAGSDPVAPPFYSEAFNWDPTTDGTLDRYEEAVLMGAKRCRVVYPGLEKPLYGVLAICPINDATSESSAKRAYRMAVPVSYVEQAKGARISVVYQPYKIPLTNSGRMMIISAEGKMAMKAEAKARKNSQGQSSSNRVSWILWLSDAPFADHDPNWTPPAGGGQGE